MMALKTPDDLEKIAEIETCEPAETAASRTIAAATSVPSGAKGAVVSLTTFSLAEFEGKPAPPRLWIVPGLIPDRNVTDLSGDGGTGKSLLALQLAVAMATGTDWIGMMPTPGGALYVSCEDEIDEIRRRAEAIAVQRGFELADLSDLHIADLTTAPATELAAPDKRGRLTLTSVFDALEMTIRKLKPKLVILDTRADAFGGSEIDRSQVRLFVRALRRLCLEHDLAILLISHPSLTGMISGTGQSGSTAWGNGVRSRLNLERLPKENKDNPDADPDLRILTSKKSNYSGVHTSITLRWQHGVFCPEGTGPAALDQIALERAADKRFIELLREFEKQGRHVNNAGGAYYAPKQFATYDDKFNKRQFRAAQERLFAAGKIRVEPFGSPSRNTKKIVEVVE